jgi:hypothetical protein
MLRKVITPARWPPGSGAIVGSPVARISLSYSAIVPSAAITWRRARLIATTFCRLRA